MNEFESIRQAISADPENKSFTEKGYLPIFMASSTAKILIIGQAPGLTTQEKNAVFLDQSGERLRSWMGVDFDDFYTSGDFAVLPLDFYYPGKGKTGDLPPRKGFASKWHPALIQCMPDIKLTILIGRYAAEHTLKERVKANLTETVKAYNTYLPEYFPLVHPSPLNRRWLIKNPYFEEEIVLVLREKVKEARKR